MAKPKLFMIKVKDVTYFLDITEIIELKQKLDDATLKFFMEEKG